MQYAHHLLKGSTLSEAQKRMIEMYDEKKKKEELEKKDKVSSMMTKTSVKKEDEKEEEKPDLRSKYAMINLIKNKLRAAGQRDPMVMAVDACEEKIDETIIKKDGTPTHGAPNKTKRDFKTQKRDFIRYKQVIEPTTNHLTRSKNEFMKTEERTPAKDDPAFDIMRPGGKNSPYNEDETKKTKPTGPKGGDKKGLRYNPYGSGTANPSNMAPGKP